MEAFVSFFNEYLPKLEETYNWPVSTKTKEGLANFAWYPIAGTADECIAMKHHLTNVWADAEHNERQRLARWIVADWGGVRANGEGKINGYVDSIVAGNQLTELQGVASYSKILSVVDCTQYAIYDARVAACLNAVQLLYPTLETRQFFPHVPSRNNTVKRFANEFAKRPNKEIWTPVCRADAYTIYCQLLHNLKAHFSGHEIYHFEMTLFSQAPDMCIKAMETALSVDS